MRAERANLVASICAFLQDIHPESASLQELGARFHFSPFHLQRAFKAATGITPRQFSAQLRSERFKAQVRGGQRISDAIYAAGYGSSSRVYERSDQTLGMTPTAYRRQGAGMTVFFSVVACPLGFLLVAATERGICKVSLGDCAQPLIDDLGEEFAAAERIRDDDGVGFWTERILAYLKGWQPHLDLPLDVRATAFQIKVWQQLQRIPVGETRTYSEVAAAIGQPTAARAVANACASNPAALVIPCHRIIRKDRGKHLALYTDLPPQPAIDKLPHVFDLAVPKWCTYFGIDPQEYDAWRTQGFLMKEKRRFEAVGLLPEDLPPFRSGYARGAQLWLYEQPTDYYRRHLLLHEGTHAFMYHALGGCGPPWYMEGMAELLGTHAYGDGRITVAYFPASRDEVPMLGRIRMVQDAFKEGRALNLPDILAFDTRKHTDNEAYGWCWAAAAFLDGHPQYRERFRELYRHVAAPNFNRKFAEAYREDWPHLIEEWQLFVATLEHGHDVARMAIDFTPCKPIDSGTARFTVRADHGWQNTGLRLEQGVPYSVAARGRYQVADQPQIWWCEPGGVTIRYYDGRPLGMLLAAVRPDEGAAGGVTPLIRPVAIGLRKAITPEASGTLYLRINDSAGELDDNAGELEVEIAVAR